MKPDATPQRGISWVLRPCPKEDHAGAFDIVASREDGAVVGACCANRTEGRRKLKMLKRYLTVAA